MPIGTLEVLLVDARGLDNNDFLADMDPYVLLTVNTQEKKSTVVSAQGSSPEWNETFLFTISDDSADLHLKIMEKDNFSADDYVGEATISLEPVFEEGSIFPTAYNVVNQEKEYRGGIKVGLKSLPSLCLNREASTVLERVLKQRRTMVAGNSLLMVRSNRG